MPKKTPTYTLAHVERVIERLRSMDSSGWMDREGFFEKIKPEVVRLMQEGAPVSMLAETIIDALPPALRPGKREMKTFLENLGD